MFGNIVIHRPAAVTSIAPPLCRQGIISYKDADHPYHGQLGATQDMDRQDLVATKEFQQLLARFFFKFLLCGIFE